MLRTGAATIVQARRIGARGGDREWSGMGEELRALCGRRSDRLNQGGVVDGNRDGAVAGSRIWVTIGVVAVVAAVVVVAVTAGVAAGIGACVCSRIMIGRAATLSCIQ